jgi:3-oxoacyl-[acyl-carrier protein] reductase
MACDLADAASIAACAGRAGRWAESTLVNNASGFGMATTKGWAAGLSVDVPGDGAQLAAPRCRGCSAPGAAGGASIVHISSIAAFRPSMRTPAYAAVKAAMNSYTGSQAALLSRQGIRVNAIAPGSIEFPGGVWDQRKTDNPTLYERTLKSIPFGVRHRRRGRRGGAVPRLDARALGHGAGAQRRRRPAAGRVGRAGTARQPPVVDA